MPGRRINPAIALCVAVALAAAVADCSGVQDISENIKEGNVFQKPVFKTPDWARVRPVSTASLGPKGPVAPEDLVDASGRCAPAAPKVLPQECCPVVSAPPRKCPPPRAPREGRKAGWPSLPPEKRQLIPATLKVWQSPRARQLMTLFHTEEIIPYQPAYIQSMVNLYEEYARLAQRH